MRRFWPILEISQKLRNVCMRTRKAGRPYAELGDLLARWRGERHRSALAFHRAGRFSFSYSTYADYERGASLPVPAEILEVARSTGHSPDEAIWVWGRVQMPTRELRKLFSRAEAPAPSREQLEEEAQSREPDFENTWVLAEPDRRALLDHPWLWKCVLALVARFPRALPIERLPLPTDVTPTEARRALKPWLERGALESLREGVRLASQHVHLPRGADWEEVRRNNYRLAAQELLAGIAPPQLEALRAFRSLTHRPLTDGQLEAWIRSLRRLEREFLSEPYVSSAGETAESPYGLMIVLGRRELWRKKRG